MGLPVWGFRARSVGAGLRVCRCGPACRTGIGFRTGMMQRPPPPSRQPSRNRIGIRLRIRIRFRFRFRFRIRIRIRIRIRTSLPARRSSVAPPPAPPCKKTATVGPDRLTTAGFQLPEATADVNVRSSRRRSAARSASAAPSQQHWGEGGNGREVLGLAGRWSSCLLGHAARDGESRPQAAWSRSRSRCGSC